MKKIKQFSLSIIWRLIVFMIALTTNSYGQDSLATNLWQSPTHLPDYINIVQGSEFTPKAIIRFYGSNVPLRYSFALDTIGIHFRNNKLNILSSKIILENNIGQGRHASPSIGVHGSQTVVYFDGILKGDNDYSKTSIMLTKGGKFIIGRKSHIDLVFPTYNNYTRQMWIFGDGTGVFEIEKGFIADKSEKGKKADGFGSIRLSNTILVSHQSTGLPYYYRPENRNKSITKINAHLVFENTPGSIWKILTENQNYIGGLWIKANMTLETSKNLTLSGVITKWDSAGTDPYINWGGISFMGKDLQLKKTGKGTLLISGSQTYSKGSLIDILNGTVCFVSNTYIDKINLFGENKDLNGPYLRINVRENSIVEFKRSIATIEYLNIEKGAKMVVSTDAIIIADTLNSNGIIEIVKGQINTDTLQLFKVKNRLGRFSKIVLPEIKNKEWDLSRFYEFGELILVSTKKQKHEK